MSLLLEPELRPRCHQSAFQLQHALCNLSSAASVIGLAAAAPTEQQWQDTCARCTKHAVSNIASRSCLKTTWGCGKTTALEGLGSCALWPFSHLRPPASLHRQSITR
jgi:hypothetical protein